MRSVYIHIPFCKSICSYCDFCKFLHEEVYVSEYLTELEKEIDVKDWNYVSKFKTYIAVDITAFAEKWGKELVKKTVNIPKWINTKAEELRINFSKTLEEALLQKIYRN